MIYVIPNFPGRFRVHHRNSGDKQKFIVKVAMEYIQHSDIHIAVKKLFKAGSNLAFVLLGECVTDDLTGE